MEINDKVGGLKSYDHTSEDLEFNKSKLLKEFKAKEEKFKTDKDMIPLEEDDGGIDEYYSEPEDEDRNQPAYIVVEKARFLAILQRKQKQDEDS